MKLFPKDKKLEELFLAGQSPEPEVLLAADGDAAKWKVSILTGVLVILYGLIGRWLCHRKRFVRRMIPIDDVGGCNIFFEGFDWGGFRMEKAVYLKESGGDGRPVLLVNYAAEKTVPRNGRITSRIRDHLRTTKDPDVMIGRFHYLWRGRLRFLGYFTLTRIKDKN